MAQTRIRWIDIAKAIAIICMIVGNIVPWESTIRNFVFSFDVPLLFVLMGFTAEEEKSLPELWRQIKKDFWKFMVPYIAFHVADIVVAMSLYGESIDIRIWLEKLFWASGVNVKGYEAIGAIWFLNILFWTKALFSLMNYVVPAGFRGIAAVLTGIVGYILASGQNWLVLSLDVALVGVFYFYIGRLFKRNMEFFKEYQGIIVAFTGGIWLLFLGTGIYVEMAARHYPGFPYVILQSISGCVCVIAISMIVEKYSALWKLSEKIEKGGTLIIGMHHLSWRIWQLWGHGTYYDCVYNIIFSCLLAGAFICVKKWLTASYERWEKAFLIVVSLYFVRLFFSTTLFSLPWPGNFDRLLRLAAAVIVCLKFICPDCKKSRHLLLGIGGGVICMLSCFSNGYLFLWDLAVLIIGTIDVSYKKILKIYCVCGLTIFGLAVVGAFMGCIKDLVYSGPRHAFGIVYPTDFAAHVVFLILAVWVLFERIPYQVMSVVMCGFTYILYHYSRARCGSIVMGLSVIAVLYVGLTEKWGAKNRIIRGFSRLIDWLLVIWMPLCSAVMIRLSMIYNSEDTDLSAINQWISSRLSLAHNAINEYGIKVFGTAFEMIGGGSDTVTRSGYNYIDSSYCLILLQYGAAVLLIICIWNMWTAGRAVKAKKRRMVVALALISIHSMIEHHLLELAYNPFLLLVFADMSLEDKGKETVENFISKKEQWQTLLGYGVAGTGAFLIMLKLLGYGRTVVSLLQLNQQKNNYVFIVIVLFLLFVCAMLINCGIKLIVKKINKKAIEKKEIITLVQYVILMVWIVAGGEGTIRQKAGRFEESLDKGTQIIEKLRENKNSQVVICVDDIPELYKRKSGEIVSPFFTGASLHAESDILLFTDKSKDITMLTDNNFLFGELSDQQGIYTNSEEAIKVLESQGVKMTNYYSVRNQVDLQFMAGASQLRFGESGGLLIEGPSQSVAHGPWITLYKGTLLVEYRLKLLDSTVETGEIAKIRLSAEGGKNVLEEKSVNIEDFDENGYCVATIEKGIQSKEAMEFLLFANEGTVLEVEEITYGKVGK